MGNRLMSILACLYTNKADGSYSSSKMWTTLANTAATYVVVINAHELRWEILLVYLAAVGSSDIAKRLLEAKYPNVRRNGANSSVDIAKKEV